MKINIIFPMAGQGARFGYKFKPFLKIRNETFIEAAIKPFIHWKDNIDQVFFVYLEEQESLFSVHSFLLNKISELSFKSILLKNPTRGPAETISNAVIKNGLTGPVIICDCDHSIDVSPIFEFLSQNDPPDCVVPIWDIEGENVNAWSVVVLSKDGYVIDISEKQIPQTQGKPAGVIGCTYFSDISSVVEICTVNKFTNLSEVIKKYIAQGKKVCAVKIDKAEFFGDPDRLHRTINITNSLPNI